VQRPTGIRGFTAAAVVVAAAVAVLAAANPPRPTQVIRLVPKARPMSTYMLQGRFEIFTKDVTFDVPPAYHDSFAFWTERMSRNKRMEVIEMVTVTQEPKEDGSVPFRRTIPRFNLELEKKGQPLAPYGPLDKQVTTLVWEGALDRFGNQKEIKKVAGADNPEIAAMAFPQFEATFPVIREPRDIKLGEAFIETRVLPLPSRLNVLGLEDTTVRLTREYTLKEATGERATFVVKVTYANDPANPPKAPGTTCTIAGGGTGEALFDTRRGVFLNSSLPTTMTVDIEAPLRPLPEKPETADPGKGKTHLEMDLLLSGQLTVRRTWGEEED
jgi:hypothetical protein